MDNSKVYIFKEGKPFSGHSKNTGQPFTMRILHFVDPDSFATHRLFFHENLDSSLLAFKSGDRIHLETVLMEPRFQNQQSYELIVGVYSVK